MSVLNIGDLFYYPHTAEGGLFALAVVVRPGNPIATNKENAPLVFLFDEQDIPDDNGNRPSQGSALSLAFHPPAVFKKVVDHIYRNLIQHTQYGTIEVTDYLSFPVEDKEYAIAFAQMSYPMNFSVYYKPVSNFPEYQEHLNTVQKLCEQKGMEPDVINSILMNLKYAERFYSSAMRSVSSPKLSL